MESVSIPGIKITKSLTAATLELAHYADVEDAHKLETGYIDAGGKFHAVAAAGVGHALCTMLTVTVSFDTSIFTDGKYTDTNGAIWTQDEVLAALSARTIRLSVAPGDGSRARVFAATYPESVFTGVASSGDPTTALTQDYALTSMTSSWSQTKYYGVYMYGGTAANSGSTDDGSSALSNQAINISVTDITA